MEDLRPERRTEGRPVDGAVVHCPWCGISMQVFSTLASCGTHGAFQVTIAPGPAGQNRIKVKTV